MPDLIQGLDGPRTAQQELFYDLEDASAVIGWSVAELTNMAGSGTPSEAMALMKMCALLEARREKLSEYAYEVKAGRIVRGDGKSKSPAT